MLCNDRTLAVERRVNEVFADRSASDWLKAALIDALRRDPVKAMADAELLCELLTARADAVLDDAAEALWQPALPFPGTPLRGGSGQQSGIR